MQKSKHFLLWKISNNTPKVLLHKIVKLGLLHLRSRVSKAGRITLLSTQAPQLGPSFLSVPRSKPASQYYNRKQWLKTNVTTEITIQSTER